MSGIEGGGVIVNMKGEPLSEDAAAKRKRTGQLARRSRKVASRNAEAAPKPEVAAEPEAAAAPAEKIVRRRKKADVITFPTPAAKEVPAARDNVEQESAAVQESVELQSEEPYDFDSAAEKLAAAAANSEQLRHGQDAKEHVEAYLQKLITDSASEVHRMRSGEKNGFFDFPQRVTTLIHALENDTFVKMHADSLSALADLVDEAQLAFASGKAAMAQETRKPYEGTIIGWFMSWFDDDAPKPRAADMDFAQTVTQTQKAFGELSHALEDLVGSRRDRAERTTY